jgi:hypothetical protein
MECACGIQPLAHLKMDTGMQPTGLLILHRGRSKRLPLCAQQNPLCVLSVVGMTTPLKGEIAGEQNFAGTPSFSHI